MKKRFLNAVNKRAAFAPVKDTGIDLEDISCGRKGRLLKLRKAFTLSEVLIALTVIGIIAAITVPALVQKTQKQEYVSALQKAYSTLSQAANIIITENGAPCGQDGWAGDTDRVYELFKKNLISIKECGSGTGCFQQKYRHLNAPSHGGFWDSGFYTDWRRFILQDGMNVMLRGNSSLDLLNSTELGSKDFCFNMWIDVNGEKKPNEVGRDIYSFVVNDTGLYPAGCDNDACMTGGGQGCACKVLREGRMDY